MSALSFDGRAPAQQWGVRGLAAAALLFSLVATVLVGGATIAAAATGTVTGTVFQDFNGNGVLDVGSAGAGEATDRGVEGVAVTATDGAGETWTAITGPDGTYSISVTDSLSEFVSIEFSGWDPQFEPSGTSTAGTNGTSMQFAEVGDSGVDFALNVPEEYSLDNPPVVVPIQRAGSPSLAEGGTAASINAPAIVGLAYADRRVSSPQPGNFPGMVTLADFGEVGAVSSVAYQPSSNSLFAFATYKRQSGLGSLGLGGIYRVTDVLGADGSVSSAGVVQPWLDVVTDLGIDLGTPQTNAARGITGPTAPTNDTHGFVNAGKIGFGGVTLSPDGSTLYFVNLHDKQLYSLDVSDVNNPPTTFQSYDLGLGDGERPWAVTIHRDRVYVGYVETGETAGGSQPGQSAAAADLQAHVLSAPVDALGSWETALTGGLGYAKGDVYQNVLAPQSHRWNTWTDTWSWTGGGVSQTNGGWHIYPQPILSGLYFDEDGYLTLGFTDRSAVQGGNRNWASDPAVTGNYETGSSGDILLAAPVGDGTFLLESNGVAGDRTGTTGGNNEGPGGREFYNDRLDIGNGSTHREVALGSVAGLRGSGEVVSSAYDPLSGIRLAGLAWYSIENGSAVAGYEVTVDGLGGPSADGGFQKGGGLGAVSLLTRSAPVEIGNRVWFDADQDGLQSADEPAVQGMRVELRDADDNLIAFKITDANGEYIFRSDEDGFDPAGDYTVVFVKPTSGTVTLTGPNAGAFGTLNWADVSFTDQEEGANRAVDSNANADGEAPVTITGPGFNDHTIDAGLTANVTFTVTKEIETTGTPAPGTPAPGQTFTINLAALDFRGLPYPLPQTTVTLAAGEESPVFTVPVGTQVHVTEADTDQYRSVVITDDAGATHTTHTALTGSGNDFEFTVTNTLRAPGGFSIEKVVTGAFDLDDDELAAAEFTVGYTTNAGGSGSLTLNAANGWSDAVDNLPYGAIVTLTETSITGAGPSVGFGTPTWSTGDQGGGTAQITIGDGTTTALVLTNPTTQLVGGFNVTKQITGDDADRVPDGFEFVIEYSLDGGTNWEALDPVEGGDTVTGPSGIPLGTAVLLREVAPADGTDFTWGVPAFSGTGVVTDTDGTVTLTIGATDTVAVTVQNPTTGLNGQFSVTKDVTGPGESLLIGDPEFVIGYSYGSTTDQLEVRNGQIATSPLLPTGTVVTITEVTPSASWLPTGATWGTPVLMVNGVEQPNGSTITIGDATTIAIAVVNPTDVTPGVSITKGDGDATAGTIANEADTVATGEAYAGGESRDIVIRVQNTGPEALRDVVLTDTTGAGAAITSLVWRFPDGSSAAANFDAGTGQWTAQWTGTFLPDTLGWQVGDTIIGTATLTMGVGAAPHQNTAAVTAEGLLSGETVEDDDPYNAFTGAIQVIKYDGERPDPVVSSGGDWVIPGKPLVSAGQDANTPEQAVVYPVHTAQEVRWVVTNIGDTWLTDLDLADTTLNGPEIDDDWTADLSEFGGPADYSFVDDGPWQGLFPPGASFFASGTLTLAPSQEHGDIVDVIATVVVPAPGQDGLPGDQPLLDGDEPVRATVPDPDDPGNRIPFEVTDDDPFHARSGIGPFVSIEKGDGADGVIAHDADTMATGVLYGNGETRTIVFQVVNTGDEDLVEVELTDTTLSGPAVQALRFTMPDGTNVNATLTGSTWTARWHATFTGTAVWEPGDVIYGAATLTLDGGVPHVNSAEVHARGAGSGIAVTDTDPYNAFTAGIQVIKYDGDQADPVVRDGSTWVIPAKPLVDAGQDANDAEHAVRYIVDEARTVRWVVTNTGSTWLTSIDLADVTDAGPAVTSWTADLSDFGGPADYDFVSEGTWHGLLPPGASFFAEGALTLGADVVHANTVTVEATPVVPEVDDDGIPTGDPQLDDDGDPVLVTRPDGSPVRVSDDDPFHAFTRTSGGSGGGIGGPGLSDTGVGVALAGLLMMAIAAIGAGLGLLRTGGRRQRA